MAFGGISEECFYSLLQFGQYSMGAMMVNELPTMLEGIAKGGPRNGIRLSASPRWDGRVRKPTSKLNHGVTDPESMRVSFYQGHYVWKPVSTPPTFYETWVWITHQVADQPKRNKPHHKRSDSKDSKHDW